MEGVVRAPSALLMTTGSPPLHDGYDRVGRTEVNAYDLSHRDRVGS